MLAWEASSTGILGTLEVIQSGFERAISETQADRPNLRAWVQPRAPRSFYQALEEKAIKEHRHVRLNLSWSHSCSLCHVQPA